LHLACIWLASGLDLALDLTLQNLLSRSRSK